MRLISILFISLFLFACAKTEEQLLDSSKQEALYHLTHDKCARAKDALDQVDYQNDDAEYIRLYSDVYGCYGGYSQLAFIESLTSLSATSADLFKTMAAFSTSQVETSADSDAYTYAMSAIDQLIYAGGLTTPSATARIAKFGATAAGDIHLQALLLIVYEMGKYFAYYGDVDATGAKGGGGNWNCLAEYTDATALGYLATNGSDTCTSGANTSSVEMETSDADYERRLCEGVILFNNFQDVISNLSFSSNSDELGQLTEAGSVLDTIETTAAGAEPAVTDYKDITSQDACETLATTKGPELQRYFALVIENLHN